MDQQHDKQARLSLVSDLAVALAVAVAFGLFAATVFQMDEMAGSRMEFPPGRTVYM